MRARRSPSRMISNLGGTRRKNLAGQDSKGQSLSSKEGTDQLNFADKLLPEVCFKHIEKKVHRQRREKDEERLWSWFVEQKMKDLRLDSQRELSDLTNLESTTTKTGELVVFPEKNKLAEMAMAVDVNQDEDEDDDADIIERKENRESCMESGAEEEVIEEISSGKIGMNERAAKKSNSDPAMSTRRRGYAKQLLRAVHTGKRKEAPCCRGRADEDERTSREKYESGGGNDEGGGYKVGGKSGRTIGRENESESEMKIGQSVQETYRRIPLEQPTMQRVEAMRQRILSLLDQILYRLCRIPLPDGENDLQRKQRRSMEFAVRFSRNYLYDLNRLVTRLQRNVQAIGRLKVRSGRYSIIDIDLIERELVAAHQLLLHALTAYSNHIPTAALISHTARLTQVLLRLIVDLEQVSHLFQLSDRSLGSGDTSSILRLGEQSDNQLLSKCQAILTRFDEQWTINGQTPKANPSHRCAAPAPAATASTALLLASDSGNNRTTWDHGCCTNRLRMYNRPQLAAGRPLRKQQHRPAGIYRSRGNKRETLLKNKSNKSIPAASATISKQLQRPRQAANVPPTKISYTINQTSSATHRSASTDPEPKKAEFSTMMTTTLMSTDSERAGSTLTEPCSKPKRKGTLMQPDESRHGLSRGGAALTSTNVSVNSGGSGSGSGSGSDPEPDQRSYANCGIASHRLRTNGKNTRRFQRSSTSNVAAECDKGAAAVTKREQRIVCDASCQANSQSDSARATGGAQTNNPPEGNEGRTMLTLSERTEKCFSEYRWYYQQECRSRPMYSNSTRNQPWDIVSWISDKLVNELLHQVAKELQITSVIRKMFELEFRDS